MASSSVVGSTEYFKHLTISNDQDMEVDESGCDSDGLVIDEKEYNIDESIIKTDDGEKNYRLPIHNDEVKPNSNTLTPIAGKPLSDEMVDIHQIVSSEIPNAGSEIQNQGYLVDSFVDDGPSCSNSGKCSIQTQTENIPLEDCISTRNDLHLEINGQNSYTSSSERTNPLRLLSNSGDSKMSDWRRKRRLERNNEASKRYQAKQKEQAEDILKQEREIEERNRILEQKMNECKTERDHLINNVFRIMSKDFFNVDKGMFCENFSKMAILRDQALRNGDVDAIKLYDKLLQHCVNITGKLSKEEQGLIR